MTCQPEIHLSVLAHKGKEHRETKIVGIVTIMGGAGKETGACIS